MRVEIFNLKWGMRSGEKRYPGAHWRSRFSQVPKRVPRLVDIEAAYFDPGEYIHPLTKQAVDQFIARLTYKTQDSTWNWLPRERQEVLRHYCLLPDGNQRWSPRKKDWKLPIFQEVIYNSSDNRDFWWPTGLSFFYHQVWIHWGRVDTTTPSYLDLLVFKKTLDTPYDDSLPTLDRNYQPPSRLDSRLEVVDYRPQKRRQTTMF